MIGAFPGHVGARLQAALQQAVRLLQARRWDDAERVLKPLQLEAGAHPDLLQLLGLAAKGRGDVVRAEDLFRRSLKASRTQPAVWNNLGNVLFTQDRHRDAAKAYEQAVTLQPAYPDAWMNLAAARGAMGEHKAAIAASDKALALSPGAMRALNRKGLSLMALEKFEEAESCLRAAVQADLDAFEPLNNLGIVLRERGKDAEAAEVYTAALRLRPDATDVKVGLSAAQYNTGRFPDAESALRTALAEAPAHANALRTLTTLLYTTGREEEICPAYEKALAHGPQDLALWRGYIEAFWYLERPSEGLEAIDRAERTCGPQPVFRLFRGRLLLAGGDAERALSCLEAGPDCPADVARSILVERARAWLRLGGYAEGAAELAPAVEAALDDYAILAHYETLLRLSGDSRAGELLDYERFVMPQEIEVPAGYRNHDDFNAHLREVLEKLHVGSKHPIDQSLRGGTQTLSRLFQHDDPVIRKLRQSIEEAVKAFIAKLDHKADHPFLRHVGRPWRFTGSWSVRLRDQGFHVPHYHPQGWISSAYYVALPESVADPATAEGRLQFGVPGIETPDTVAPMREVQPMVGTLALFPSYCWHGTAPFRSGDPRLTVAFDVARAQAAGGAGK